MIMSNFKKIALIFAIYFTWYMFGFQKHKRKLKFKKNIEHNDHVPEILNPNFKYILQWQKTVIEPYSFIKSGQEVFLEHRCPVNNCFVTSNKYYPNDYTKYDVILFYSNDVSRKIQLKPKTRLIHQKYVFVSTESASNYPVYHNRYNDFFNMSWTYKLDSDVFYGYILVKDKEGKKIGPKIDMNWPVVLKDMKPISNEVRQKLQNKKTAAAWAVSNCNDRTKRRLLAAKIQEELAKFNMSLDIFGACGNKACATDTLWDILENDYYFYLAFENSINEDYVTEKLLTALQHYTVPIVYGGANYTRFMPDGIYLNAYSTTVEALVQQMLTLINNKEMYYDLFRWHNHYSYYYAGDTPDTDYYCNFCEKINDASFMETISYIKEFDIWWNDWGTENNEMLIYST